MLGARLLRDRPSGREVPQHARNVETTGVKDKAVACVRDAGHDEAHVIPAREPLRLRIEDPQKPPADGAETDDPEVHIPPTGHLRGLSDQAQGDHPDPTVAGAWSRRAASVCRVTG
jgi:hypothetical protein